MAKTVDEKLLFPAYDTTPSFMGWRNFRRNALTHGGSYTDDDGWSYADHFLGDDDGGRNGTAIPAANTKENNHMRKLRRKREKGAQAFLVRHTSNVLMHDKMAEAPYLGNANYRSSYYFKPIEHGWA